MGDRRNLASFIIMDQFGPFVAKVADWLMNRGRSNVKEIRMSTSLSSKLVKESLIVLIQHNIVQAIILENQSVCYELNIEAIIMRLRFSKFVAHAKTRFHEEGELIIEELLEHGRLSMGQVLDRVSPVIKDMRAAVSINISHEQARERLQNTFEQLITHHYLVLADPPSSSTPSDSNVKPKANEIKMPGRPKAKTAAAPASFSSSSSSSSSSSTTTTTTTTTTSTTEPKKRGRKKADESAEPKKRAKKTKDKEEEEEKPKKKPGRKRKEKEIDEDVQVMQDGPSATILASASAPLISDEPPAKKTKLVSTEFGMAVVDDNAQEDEKQLETDIMWRVNFSQFIVHFKMEAIIKYVTEKFSADAGEVIQVMFNLVEKGLDSKATLSPVVMQPVLIQTLSQEAKTKNIPLNERDGYLDMMVKYNPAVLSRIGDAGYQINIENVMNVVKQRVVESVVYDKFGPSSLRIFRLLMLKKQLEQQTVSDMAMIPLNESRSALYEMFTKGYLHLQEVSRQADHTPTKTFFLFNVNLPSVYSLLTQDMSKGVFNLLVRLSCEIERYKDVCYRADTFLEGTLSEADTVAYAKFRRIVEVMECSIARLDHSTMCLTDF